MPPPLASWARVTLTIVPCGFRSNDQSSLTLGFSVRTQLMLRFGWYRDITARDCNILPPRCKDTWLVAPIQPLVVDTGWVVTIIGSQLGGCSSWPASKPKHDSTGVVMKISFVFSTVLSGWSLATSEGNAVFSVLLGDGDAMVGNFCRLFASFLLFRLPLLIPIKSRKTSLTYNLKYYFTLLPALFFCVLWLDLLPVLNSLWYCIFWSLLTCFLPIRITTWLR